MFQINVIQLLGDKKIVILFDLKKIILRLNQGSNLSSRSNLKFF